MSVGVGATIVLDEGWTFVPADVRRPPLRLGLLGFAHLFAWTVRPGVPWRLQPNLPRQCLAGACIRRVSVPSAWAGERIVLRLAGVAHHATVFVDGREVGATASPWTPQAFDLSSHVTPGVECELRIDVVDRSVYRTPEGWAGPPGLTVDLLLPDPPDRGIVFAPPTIEALPLVDVVDVRLRPDVATGELGVAVEVANHGETAFDGPVSIALARWDPMTRRAGGEATTQPARPLALAPGASATVSWTLPWPEDEAQWWWPNLSGDPDYRAALHVLTPTIAGAARASVRFGFCEVQQTGSVYRLNGRVLNLRGDNPTIDGVAASPERCRALVEGAIVAGLNVIRPHAQPAPEHLYDIADELGLCLIPETGIYASLGVLDARVAEPFTRHVRDLVRRDRLHPCVVKYSVLNEGHEADLDRDFVLALHEAAQAEDPSRPISVDESGGRDYGAPIVDIQHYSEDRDGGLVEGHPRRYLAPARADRPYGQGEFLFGADGGDHPLGLLRQGLHIRARRLNGEADIRPHTVHKHLAYDAVPGDVDERVPLHPLAGSIEAVALGHFRRSVAAVAAWDLGFDERNALPGPKGALEPDPVTTATGLRRRIAIVNDGLHAERMELRWAVDGSEGRHEVDVPQGSHAIVEVDLPALGPGVTTVELVLATDGQVRFRSAEVRLDVALPAHEEAPS